ncbi:MAG: hypothetical protein RIC16_08855 [Rhodospirillales bacterium]
MSGADQRTQRRAIRRELRGIGIWFMVFAVGIGASAYGQGEPWTFEQWSKISILMAFPLCLVISPRHSVACGALVLIAVVLFDFLYTSIYLSPFIALPTDVPSILGSFFGFVFFVCLQAFFLWHLVLSEKVWEAFMSPSRGNGEATQSENFVEYWIYKSRQSRLFVLLVVLSVFAICAVFAALFALDTELATADRVVHGIVALLLVLSGLALFSTRQRPRDVMIVLWGMIAVAYFASRLANFGYSLPDYVAYEFNAAWLAIASFYSVGKLLQVWRWTSE